MQFTSCYLVMDIGYLTFATPSRNRDTNPSLRKPRYLVCRPLAVKTNTQLTTPTTDPAHPKFRQPAGQCVPG